MKVFITGIAGFIGYHTALYFRSQGFEVVGSDNFNAYYDVRLKRARAGNLQREGVTIWEHDICSQTYPPIDADLVIHLAAMAGVRYSMEHPMQYIQNNIVGTQVLIDRLEKYNIENVIYASTSCVMHGNELPWKEDTALYKQINPYGYSKMVNESQFHMSKIPNAVGLRFFTVYGPYGRPDMALFDFTKNILEGNAITLYNFGDMKRDFTYVDDIVQGISCVANSMTERDIYNIGRGEQVELMDFVQHISDALDTPYNFKAAPKHPADAKETWSDTTKIKQIGYNPQTSIKEGVEKFVDWYKEFYEV